MYESENPGYIATSNKFYRPHIDPNQSLLRSALLENKLPEQSRKKKAIIIEAQAGQGKTTLVSQFLDTNELRYIWYQIGPEDSDPIQLLSSLLTNLKTNLDGFHSPELERILSEGIVGPLDLIRCADMLLQDLDIYLGHDIYLVFDDIYLIEFGALTNKLFEHLLDNSPPKMHFILITRHPLEIKGKTVRNGSQLVYLNTKDLALSTSEIESLYTDILAKEISHNDATQIQRVTNGWIMGILLASHPISGRSKFWMESTPNPAISPTSGHMLDYFHDEIFAQIPEHLHHFFLKLSLLTEIHVDLAVEITGNDDFGRILTDMTRENYFIYHLDDQEQVFRFHHFFQEFLQQKAKSLFSEQEIYGIHTKEANFYLRLNLTEKALNCFKRAGDYSSMEAILKDKGMELIAKNRTLTILALLQSIPDEILFQHNWLVLYSGLLRVDFAPQTTLPFWEAAQEAFVESGEFIGEIIALSQTIYFHFVISGEYIDGAKLLPRTEALLEEHHSELPTSVRIMAARNLASGYCFFNGQMEKARSYIDRATKLANRHSSQNFIASTRFIQGYIELFSGNRAKYLRAAEICFSLFNDPLVGESNRLTLRIINLCYLSMTGNHLNFLLQQQALQESIESTVIEQTVAAPYLYIWGSCSLFSVGKTKQALELLEKGLGVTATASSEHMHSQLLQWQAFGLVLSGRIDESLHKIAESESLRKKSGGPFYIAFNKIIAGYIYTRAGKLDQASESLIEGLRIAEEIPSTYLTICARFNLSHLHLLTSKEDAAIENLETGLALMKINGFDHFWTWEPKMMVQLLSLAVRRDIEKSFAKILARKRLNINFSDEGKAIPLLKFTLLDGFQLTIGDQVLFRAKDLTPFQRELLGLLITAKGQRIPQEKIQLELWPESSPENARKSFDTLLTRLRKLISPHLPLPIKQYLYLQKGILCLTNYDIDALLFVEAARTGIAHSKNSDWWQAHNSFQYALSLWKGTMPEDTFQSEQVLEFNDMLSSLLVEMCTIWSLNLLDAGRLEEAVSILERVLSINYLDEQLTSILYKTLLRQGKPLRARTVLERYRKALEKADYSKNEASEFVEEIIKSSLAKQ